MLIRVYIVFCVIYAIAIAADFSDSLFSIDRSLHFTATDATARLLDTEARMMDMLEEYIDGEYNRLEELKRFSKKFLRREEAIPYHNNLSVVVQQRNLFSIMKRLTIDLDNEEEKIDWALELSSTDFIKKSLVFPSSRDLHGAADALFRLQDTYNLVTKDIADGRIYPGVIGDVLSADDCFRLGFIAYMEFDDYYHALLWTMESYRRLSYESIPSVDEAIVLDFLSNSLYNQGDARLALFTARLLRERYPRFIPMYDSLRAFEDTVRKEGTDPNKMNVTEADLRKFVARRPMDTRVPDRDLYEALCRGESQNLTNQHHLYCYFQKSHPFLLLAPLKAEILRQEDPRILIYRNFISDFEAEILKTAAEPKFYTTDGLLSYRVSKSAWLNDLDHPAIKSISDRIEIMTGLSTRTAESLHVSNYGLGGHYEPHWDWYGYREEDGSRFEQYYAMGNRIATVLLYLSQPRIGGATVFLQFKLTVHPTKNDAVFWYNLRHDGQGDEETRHAACPVLIGSKWIANKWLHERGQEFRRPCHLKND